MWIKMTCGLALSTLTRYFEKQTLLHTQYVMFYIKALNKLKNSQQNMDFTKLFSSGKFWPDSDAIKIWR